jgi:transcriptional regulator with XRE-family HTH domain
MNDLRPNLAQNLRRLRSVRGLSLSEVARRSEVARATLTALESAKGNPTVDTLAALADVLGVEAGDLLADARRTRFSIVRANRAPDAGPMRMRFLRRFPLGPCTVDLNSFELDARTEYRESGHIDDTLVHIVLQHGELIVRAGDEEETVRQGDYACFGGDLPYTLVTTMESARGTLLLHYPSELTPGQALSANGRSTEVRA